MEDCGGLKRDDKGQLYTHIHIYIYIIKVRLCAYISGKAREVTGREYK